jgi:predicted phosphohydrolase
MKIQYWSDLHLEFKENIDYLMQRRIDVMGDILILAGDITYWSELHFAHPFFDKVSEKFNQVYMIPGNHEFYNGFDISILEKPLKINIRDNVFLVNNITETINGIDFFFTALWAKIKPQNAFYIEQKVNDFHLIKYNGETLKATEFNRLCNQSFKFLEDSVQESFSKKKVVVTHHCPTQLANAKEFRDSEINNAFVIELYDFIYHNPIDYWIFGHTHRNEPEVNINGTKVISNQLGYVNWMEHKTFKMDAFIEV